MWKFGLVIRAISPTNNFHNYLVSHAEVKNSLLIRMLRSHSRRKDSTSTSTEYCNASQTQNESYIDFL